MRLDHLDTDTAIAIRTSLEKYKLKQWGFVIFRCTYGSQEAWDKFLTLAKQDAHDHFEWRGMEDVYDSITWTVIEDAETLDGASIVDTSRKFTEWVGGEGRQEMQGSVFTDTWVYCPRYIFFIHVDQESLESVADDTKAREAGGYFCTVVQANGILNEERYREAREDRHREGQGATDEDDEDDEDDEEILWDFRKRFKVDNLVQLYAWLLDIDSWYNILDHKGIAFV